MVITVLSIFLVILGLSDTLVSRKVEKRQAMQYSRPVDPQTIRVTDLLQSFEHSQRSGSQPYPVITDIQQTSFDCRKQAGSGYYADPETGCQQYHRCDEQLRRTTFLCPPGTLFNQLTLVCDYPYHVDCGQSAKYAQYSNSRLYQNALPLLDTANGNYVYQSSGSSSGSGGTSGGTGSVSVSGSASSGGGQRFGVVNLSGGQAIGTQGGGSSGSVASAQPTPNASDGGDGGVPTASPDDGGGALGTTWSLPNTDSGSSTPATVDQAARKFAGIFDPVPTGTDSLAYEGVTRPSVGSQPGQTGGNPGGSLSMSVTSGPLQVQGPQHPTGGGMWKSSGSGSQSAGGVSVAGQSSGSAGSQLAGTSTWQTSGGNIQATGGTTMTVAQTTTPIHVSVVTACDKAGVVDFAADGMRDALLLSLKSPNGSGMPASGTSATITVHAMTDNSTDTSSAEIYSLLNPVPAGSASSDASAFTTNPMVMEDSYYIFESADKPVFIKFAKYNVVVEVRPEAMQQSSP